MTYSTLSTPCQAEYEIKKSQFLAFAYPIDTKECVTFHVEQLKKTYPDARHYCSAYILGNPENTTAAGFDDDGEPNGTAGRPILSVLQHKCIGNVLVVVVRYFGGIKLGAGGLTRAYATATQMAVDKMVLTTFVAKSVVSVLADFAAEAQVRYLINQSGGEVLRADYAACGGTRVCLSVQLPSDELEAFELSLGVFGEIMDK